MGSGTRKPNTPVVPKRSRFADGDGKPAVNCPEEGSLLLRESKDLIPGTQGALVLESEQITFLVEGQAVGHCLGPGLQRIAKCLSDGFDYFGEVEFDDGEAIVRYRLA